MGLYGIPHLRVPADWARLSSNTLTNAKAIAAAIRQLPPPPPVSSPAAVAVVAGAVADAGAAGTPTGCSHTGGPPDGLSPPPPAPPVLPAIDALSNTLCTVLDAAEFARHTHPDAAHVAAAGAAYEELASYTHGLNADAGLYGALTAAADAAGISRGGGIGGGGGYRRAEGDGGGGADGGGSSSDRKWRCRRPLADIDARMLSSLLADMRRGGMGLPPAQRQRVVGLAGAAAAASATFYTAAARAERLCSPAAAASAAMITSSRHHRSGDDSRDAAVAAADAIVGPDGGGGGADALVDLLVARHALATALGEADWMGLAFAGHDRAVGGVRGVDRLLGGVASALRAGDPDPLLVRAREVKAADETVVAATAEGRWWVRRGRTPANGEGGESGGSGSGELPPLLPWDEAHYRARAEAEAEAVAATEAGLESGGALPVGAPPSLPTLPPRLPLSVCIRGVRFLLRALFSLRMTRVGWEPGEAWAPGVDKYALSHASTTTSATASSSSTTTTTATATAAAAAAAPGGGAASSPSPSPSPPLATVYLDCLPRVTKFAAAAHFTIRCSRRVGGGGPYAGAQTPVVALVTNFGLPRPREEAEEAESPPHSVGRWRRRRPRRPAAGVVPAEPTLSPPQLRTLLHETGHLLQSALSASPYQHTSGTRVAVDAVEIPAVLAERAAAWPPLVDRLARWAGHPPSSPWPSPPPPSPPPPSKGISPFSLPLPSTPVPDAVRAARGQLFLARLDVELHSAALHADLPADDPAAARRELKARIAAAVRRHRAATTGGGSGGTPPGTDDAAAVATVDLAYAVSVGHLGSYGAGYYAYLLAEVVAAGLAEEVAEGGGQRVVARLTGVLAAAGGAHAADAVRAVVGGRGEVGVGAYARSLGLPYEGVGVVEGVLARGDQ